MAKKPTLTCTTPYGVFTRSTHHKYTYVLVVGGESITMLERAIGNARDVLSRGTYTSPDGVRRTYTEHLKHRLETARAHDPAKGYAFSWHHTRAAAEQTSRTCPCEVRGIYPVDVMPSNVPVATVLQAAENYTREGK